MRRCRRVKRLGPVSRSNAIELTTRMLRAARPVHTSTVYRTPRDPVAPSSAVGSVSTVTVPSNVSGLSARLGLGYELV